MIDARGGAGRGQGRKPLDPKAPSLVFQIRLSQAQRDKLNALGGAFWIRKMIEHARLDEQTSKAP